MRKTTVALVLALSTTLVSTSVAVYLYLFSIDLDHTFGFAAEGNALINLTYLLGMRENSPGFFQDDLKGISPSELDQYRWIVETNAMMVTFYDDEIRNHPLKARIACEIKRLSALGVKFEFHQGFNELLQSEMLEERCQLIRSLESQ